MSDQTTKTAEDKPAVNSLYVTPNGDAYRLSGYRTDWKAEPFTGEQTVPDYKVGWATGGFSMTTDLPDDARLVWSPQDPTPQMVTDDQGSQGACRP